MGKKQWLVKNNGKILGPYTKDEIEAHLFRREIVTIDEVVEPLGMWMLIRDHESFAKIVRKLVIEEVDLLENTKVLHNVDTEGYTKTLSISSSHHKEEPSKGEAYDTGGEVGDEYIYADNYRSNDKSGLLILGVSFLVILSFATILYFKIASLSDRKIEKYRVLLVQGGDLVHQGKFDEALSMYQKAYQIDSRASDFHIHLGALLVRSGETVEARRLLEKLFS